MFRSLNEVQFPKELQRSHITTRVRRLIGLNEVQFPKELQRRVLRTRWINILASMKCSSRRNCNSRFWVYRMPL